MIVPEIVVFDTGAARLDGLRSVLRVPFVSFALGTGPEVTKSKDLDAMWFTPMQAERFGVMPPFPLHVAQVLDTPTSDVQKGLPRFIVVGVAIASDDPRDPQWQLHLVISSLLSAIKEAGAQGYAIRRVGMLPEHLLLHKVRADAVPRIIEAAYEEHYPSAKRSTS